MIGSSVAMLATLLVVVVVARPINIAFGVLDHAEEFFMYFGEPPFQPGADEPGEASEQTG